MRLGGEAAAIVPKDELNREGRLRELTRELRERGVMLSDLV